MILEFLFSLNETTLILLTIFFYIAAFGQTYYALQTAFCETDEHLSGVVLYEFLLAFHLVLACAVANPVILTMEKFFTESSCFRFQSNLFSG